KGERLLWREVLSLVKGDAKLEEELSVLMGSLDEVDRKATPEENAKTAAAQVRLDPRRYALKLHYIKESALKKDAPLDMDLALYQFVTELQQATTEAELEPIEAEQARRDFILAVRKLLEPGTYRW